LFAPEELIIDIDGLDLLRIQNWASFFLALACLVATVFRLSSNLSARDLTGSEKTYLLIKSSLSGSSSLLIAELMDSMVSICSRSWLHPSRPISKSKGKSLRYLEFLSLFNVMFLAVFAR
jgi:hypothetical protein